MVVRTAYGVAPSASAAAFIIATGSVNWNGRSAPVMVAAYTDDGGHLNAKGKLLAARELIAVLGAATKPLQKIDDSATPVRMSR